MASNMRRMRTRAPSSVAICRPRRSSPPTPEPAKHRAASGRGPCWRSAHRGQQLGRWGSAGISGAGRPGGQTGAHA
jgi:hypothetical protein